MLNQRVRKLAFTGLLVLGAQWLGCSYLSAQSPPLHVQIVKGDGSNNNAVASVSATAVVRVTSAGGETVPDALVVFTAPSSGPSVDFGGDGAVAQAITDESGVAVAPHIRPTGGNGPVELRVLATKNGEAATLSIYQMNLGVKQSPSQQESLEITILPSGADAPSGNGKTVSGNIHVRVSNGKGRPVAGAAVQCVQRKTNASGGRTEELILLDGVTDGSGELSSSISYRSDRGNLPYLIRATFNGRSATRYLATLP